MYKYIAIVCPPSHQNKLEHSEKFWMKIMPPECTNGDITDAQNPLRNWSKLSGFSTKRHQIRWRTHKFRSPKEDLRTQVEVLRRLPQIQKVIICIIFALLSPPGPWPILRFWTQKVTLSKFKFTFLPKIGSHEKLTCISANRSKLHTYQIGWETLRLPNPAIASHERWTYIFPPV